MSTAYSTELALNNQYNHISERTRQRIIADLQSQVEVSTRYRVLYLKDRKEHKTPWFKVRERADIALKLMQQKYGEKNAIIYVD